MTENPNSVITHIDLHEPGSTPDSELIRRDKQIALHDLIAHSVFQPVKDDHGPYAIELSIEDNRLVFRIKNAREEDLPMLVLSLKPYQRLIKDYFIIVGSYDATIKNGQPSRVEAIDMGRRALHNEGASLLIERLGDKIEMDLDTARRLFTLICVLHAGKASMWR
ncbi:MAG: UPF0262 protein [Micavibrio sp.]|nr:MAG: UPF0262 protein [Micavibrio sp.]